MIQGTGVSKYFSILFAGVGGQGVLSMAQLTMEAARREGYYILQSEIHGMSQRGGMVNSHVQFATEPIFSPIISQGSAQLIVATEPLESLRYVSYLRKDGLLISTQSCLKNFSGHPGLENILAKIQQIPSRMIDTDPILQKVGLKQGLSTLLLGLASQQMPIANTTWESVIADLFASKGAPVIEKNKEAFKIGREM